MGRHSAEEPKRTLRQKRTTPPKHRASEPRMERIVDDVPSGFAPRSARSHVANDKSYQWEF